MPPHLHPRSTATSTLFAGTLLASFIVVGIPHVFPCPRPRKGYADSDRQLQLDADGRPIQRQQQQQQREERGSVPSAGVIAKNQSMQAAAAPEAGSRKGAGQPKSLHEEAELFRQLQEEAQMLDRQARECPVPKPKGVIGRLLGFEEGSGRSAQTDKS